MAVMLKKGFCSWVCPFGLLSEYLTKIHIRLFDRQRKLPAWLDYPLRSLKYLLLLFFANAIFMQMRVRDLEYFIYSPYNRVADIKMLHFFTDMSSLTFWTLVLLILFSIAIPYFWCRYLCPYGALLGMLSWLSPFKIRRNNDTCIDCEKCTKVCPARIKVHSAGTVRSDECHACLQCVDVCPVIDTLYLSSITKKNRLSPKVYGLVLLLIFALGTTAARIGGVWQNTISGAEYRYHIEHMNDPEYNHIRGNVADYDKAKWGNGTYPGAKSLEGNE
jgi:polyferredoxin